MKRSIVTCIILSIVTCGIYGIYWFVKLTDEMNAMTANPNGTSGVTAYLLSLVTCGIYTYYWCYKMGEKVDYLKTRRGQSSSSSSILYLILGILGVGIVNYVLIQDEINNNIF